MRRCLLHGAAARSIGGAGRRRGRAVARIGALFRADVRYRSRGGETPIVVCTDLALALGRPAAGLPALPARSARRCPSWRWSSSSSGWRRRGARCAMLSGTAGLMLVLALDLFSAGWVQRLYFSPNHWCRRSLFDFACMSFPKTRAFRSARAPGWRLAAVSAALRCSACAERRSTRPRRTPRRQRDLCNSPRRWPACLAVVSWS